MKNDFLDIRFKFNRKMEDVKVTFSTYNNEKFGENEYDVVELKLNDILSKEADIAAIFLGKIILSLLSELDALQDQQLSKKLAIDNDLLEITAVLEAKANEGDVKALELLASHYETLSIKHSDEELLEKAEKSYKKAITLGSDWAKKYIEEEWSELKKTYVSIINNKK